MQHLRNKLLELKKETHFQKPRCFTSMRTCIFSIVTIFILLCIINMNFNNPMPPPLVKLFHVKTLEKYTNPHKFVSECNSGDLFRLQRVENSNASIALPISKNVSCPRILSSPNFSLPLTGLLSFPGSGNTWVRHILQQLTGIPTGAIYKDPTLLRNGFPSEGKLKDVLVVKSHGSMHHFVPNYVHIDKYKRVIAIIRNVYDTFLAEFRRLHLTGKNHTANSVVDTSDARWLPFLETASIQWLTFMQETFSFQGPLLVIFYEDLKTELFTQLIRIAQFLSVKGLTEFSFCCVMKELEGSFHRKSNNQTVDRVFGSQERILINKRIYQAAKTLQITKTKVSKRLLSYIKPITFT